MIIKENKFSQAPENVLKVEEFLRATFGIQEVFMLGRAATGFLMAYRTIKSLRPDIADPEIILPSISCATPSNTAMICGLHTRYADTNISDGLISVEDIKRKVTPKTVAVLYIHLFGHTDPKAIFELKQWCQERKIYLIEDVAQSLGGRIDAGTISGSVGDFVIFSFNKTKIIESGGGALGVRTKELFDSVKTGSDISGYTGLDQERRNELSVSYRNMHLKLVADKRKDPEADIYTPFQLERQKYSGLFYKEAFGNAGIISELRDIEHNLAHRYLKAKIYEEKLRSLSQITMLDGWQNSGCCWRFSFLVNSPEALVNFSEAVRKDGFHVSNLYWPVNHFFKPDDDCPNADSFARRIVNTWVNEEVSPEWIEKCCESIIKHSHLI